MKEHSSKYEAEVTRFTTIYISQGDDNNTSSIYLSDRRRERKLWWTRKAQKGEIRSEMNIDNPALPIHHITINIVEINWQQQQNFMFIHSATFINKMGIHHGQQPNLVPSYLTAILALLTFIVPVLINLIDLKFQKEANSVFEANPIATMVAFASLLAFVLAFGIDFTFHSSHLSPTCAALLRTSMLFSGSLSLASLASLLLPDAFRPFLFVLYALLSLANLHNLVRKWYHWVFRTTMDNPEVVAV